MRATRAPKVSRCVEKFLSQVVEKIVRNRALVQDLQACSHSWTKLSTLVIPTPRPVLIPGRNAPPLSFRRRKAEESAALHIVAESILRCSQCRGTRPRPPPDLHESPCTT